jgi:hypothetical protein
LIAGFVQSAALFVGQEFLALKLPADALDFGGGFLGALEGPLREGAVDGQPGDLFQKLAALFVVGPQKRGEVSLRQQNRPPELIEAQTQQALDFVLRLAELARAEFIVFFEVPKLMPGALEVAVHPAAGAVDGPAGPPSLTVAGDEIDFGPALAGAPAQNGPGVST